MAITLRDIADAVWGTRGDLQASGERDRIRDRARMLRDKGLILSTIPHSQGRTMTFTDADTAAAVVALTASLNGMSWGIIEAINGQLREIGDTTGEAAFDRHIDEIRKGVPVHLRLDLRIHDWPHSVARMGGAELLAEAPAQGTTQVLIWPVTALAKPVLDRLEGASA